ncbi:MAG: type II 3-dehydroquinate dehydratase [Prevotella sp.]|nr:type II 3-dehydroquinate dehydratase [Candidatus Equicola stercoris]
MRFQIINGPNLNLLGTRSPEIYGNESFDAILQRLRTEFPNDEIDYFQNNCEGVIIDKLQETGFSYDGIVLNAGAYSHTSIAIRDCIAAIKTPVVEVHISNIFAREEFRRQSMISSICKGVICGFGADSYSLALHALKKQ